MKMKSYKATFFRHNPQFKNGGYVTERKIEAVSLPSARKRAREISEHCVYGSMELLSIYIPVRKTHELLCSHGKTWLPLPATCPLQRNQVRLLLESCLC